MDVINSRPTEAEMRLKYDHVTKISKSDLKCSQNFIRQVKNLIK